MGLLDWLPFGQRKRERTRREVEELRRSFKARYGYFRTLLHENNKGHEFMVDMEEALRGHTPYGMNYVRAMSTRLTASVFSMVRALQDLAPGKHESLMDRFLEIQSNIQNELESNGNHQDGPLVMDIADLTLADADLSGAKMASLAEGARAVGAEVPLGFVVTSVAFSRFMAHNGLQEEIDRIIQATPQDRPDRVRATTSRVMQLIMSAEVPQDVVNAMHEACGRYCEIKGEGARIAVRSSALGEDLEGMAFAGQYRSILNVAPDELVNAYREVCASKYSLEATSYRHQRGIPDEDVAMCVGCMEMIDACSGGVAYTGNPVNRRDQSISIFSVFGLPKTVVDGSEPADVFTVERMGSLQIRNSEVAEKLTCVRCLPGEGTAVQKLDPSECNMPSLNDEQVLQVAELSAKLEEHFGSAQDVEWAYDEDDRLLLLQCRPLNYADAEGMPGLGDSIPDLPPALVCGSSTASTGVAAGRVHRIIHEADTLTFSRGDVLVLRQALPVRAALLDRAAAVVAESGSVAGHLANVAREYGVPALFGVQDVMEKLEQGALVTVDATGRSVYDGKVEIPEKLRRKPRNLMLGSPVQKLLMEVVRHVIRLRLTDPDGTDFRISNCQTLHDIMRYCHEHAVREMFKFTSGSHLREGGARQLVTDVPKQFWVINLDDGYTEKGIKRKDGYIGMSQLTSTPMLALWEGMTAVPWDGPPPVDAGGFMSVMFEATVNPALDPALDSAYSTRNYFMISKNFCSLQSRFGFHFCGAEAFVTQRAMENYASFRFQGGAADFHRRKLRAEFVAELLDLYDFRTKVRGDNLTARLEDLDCDSMIHRLRVLGYLIIHTRQLDMIMSDPTEVEARRSKMLIDLGQFGMVTHCPV